MLSALIIILREVLEAGLIISALLAAARINAVAGIGVVGGIVLGLAGAIGIAAAMDTISNLADGVGQELLNVLLDSIIIVLLACHSAGSARPRWRYLMSWSAAGAVACAVSREFSEIVLYGSGFSTSFSAFMPVLIGGVIGTGIGVSVAALLYYLLIYQPPQRALRITSILLALLAAGMAAEAMGFLEQAGLAPAQRPYWDTSHWVAESSPSGQLLHALIGYEATPTPLQIGAYTVVFALVIGLGALRRSERSAA
jgi:high-affinity iron transporter